MLPRNGRLYCGVMDARCYAPWLGALTALFAVRVIAQPLARVLDVPWLPRFERWHSGALPYGALLAAQILILVAQVRTTLAFSRGAVSPNPRLGRGLLVAGVLYLASMVARLILGLTVLRGHRWFDVPLPTLFHFVLAAFVILVGLFHARRR